MYVSMGNMKETGRKRKNIKKEKWKGGKNYIGKEREDYEVPSCKGKS